jgi:hypothetical protein
MVVDDVKDDGEAVMVGLVHETAEVIGLAVEARGCKEIDAVVSPAEAAGELRDRHQLDAGDAELGQLLQLARRCRPRSLAREGADMHLIDDLPCHPRTRPLGVRPAEPRWINDA